MKNAVKKQKHAMLRAKRTRSVIHGTAARPRLSVKRSSLHIYTQLIDDDKGVTIIAVSDRDVEKGAKPVETAKTVGLKLAEKAKEAGINSVVFDRGYYRYHGRVAAIAEGAREGGLML